MIRARDDYLTDFEKFYLFTLTKRFEKGPDMRPREDKLHTRLRSNSCHFLNINSMSSKKAEKSIKLAKFFQKRLSKVTQKNQ